MILGRFGVVATIIAMLGLPALSQVVQPPSGGGGGATTFDQIGSGTNLGHGLVVGNGSVLSTATGGFINANENNGQVNGTSAALAAVAGTPSSATAAAVGADVAGAAASAQAASEPLLKRPVAFYVGGDSYQVGSGSLNPLTSSGAGLIAAAAGIPYLNGGQPGAGTPVINYLNVGAFIPNPQLPTVVFNDGGANDVSCTTAGCITNYKEEMTFMLPWFSIPTQYRIMGSAATVTGTWGNDNGFPAPFFPASVAGITTGNPISTTTSGATATFNVPTSASTKVGVSFIVANTQTGTFSLSIDGTLQTDTCSGTTTFSSGPCAGTTLIVQTATTFRQEFTVTPNQTHTVVVTSLSAAKIDVTAVDWLPPSTVANINPVFQMNTNLSFNPAATFNTALATVIATLGTGGDGLPIYLVDQVAGSPGVNNTTDTATTATSTCPASTLASHPNDCGYLHMAQTFYNVEKAVGYVFTKAPSPADTASIVGGTIQGATITSSPISGSTGSFTTITNTRSGTVTAAVGTGVTSVTCATATCTTERGTYTIVGGTGTTGTIATLTWPTTTTAWACTTSMNGGTAYLGVGHSVATVTGMTISSAVSVTGLTLNVDYQCRP